MKTEYVLKRESVFSVVLIKWVLWKQTLYWMWYLSHYSTGNFTSFNNSWSLLVTSGQNCENVTEQVEKHCSLKLIEEDLLFFLGLGVYVSQHSDVREVYPELAQQSGHPAQKQQKQRVLGWLLETSCKTFSIPGAVDRDNSTESSWRPGKAALNSFVWTSSFWVEAGRTGFTGSTVAFCVWESFPLASTSKKPSAWKHYLSHMESFIQYSMFQLFILLNILLHW